jgi:hypothetical protein
MRPFRRLPLPAGKQIGSPAALNFVQQRSKLMNAPILLNGLVFSFNPLAEPMAQHNSFVTLFWGRKLPFLDRH